jgi:hypothetical protein
VVKQQVAELLSRRRRQARQHVVQVRPGSTPDRWHVDVKPKSTAVRPPCGEPTNRQLLRPYLFSSTEAVC